MNKYLQILLEGDIPREWSFPAAEYRARRARAREAMRSASLDVLLVHSVTDLCYFTGYQTLWPDAYACLVLPVDGDPFMQVGEVEASCAVLHGDIEDLTLLDWVGASSAPQQLADLLVARGFSQARIGVQMGRIEFGNRGPVDAALYRGLVERMSAALFEDATYLAFDLRVAKSAAEIEHLRAAAAITSKGMQAAIEAAEVGMNENDLAAIGAEVMIANGSEPFSIDPIVNAGHRTGYFHTTFKRAPIKSGDHVQLEFGGCWHRYTAPMMRTLIMGKPGAEVRKIMDANVAALDLLYANVRAGRSAHDVYTATVKGVEAFDDRLFRSGHFGYSVGVGFPPTWTDGPMYLARDVHRELEPGMCFHTPFSWRIPKVFVVGTSETIVVTETGCEILTDLERVVTVKA